MLCKARTVTPTRVCHKAPERLYTSRGPPIICKKAASRGAAIGCAALCTVCSPALLRPGKRRRLRYSGSTRMAASRWWRMRSSLRRGRAGRSGGAPSARRLRLQGVRASSSASPASSAQRPREAGEAHGEAAAPAAPRSRRASGDRSTGLRRTWRALAGLRRRSGRQVRRLRGRSGAQAAQTRLGQAEGRWRGDSARAWRRCSASLRRRPRSRRSSRWRCRRPRRGGAAGRTAARTRNGKQAVASAKQLAGAAAKESHLAPRHRGRAGSEHLVAAASHSERVSARSSGTPKVKHCQDEAWGAASAPCAHQSSSGDSRPPAAHRSTPLAPRARRGVRADEPPGAPGADRRPGVCPGAGNSGRGRKRDGCSTLAGKPKADAGLAAAGVSKPPAPAASCSCKALAGVSQHAPAPSIKLHAQRHAAREAGALANAASRGWRDTAAAAPLLFLCVCRQNRDHLPVTARAHSAAMKLRAAA